MRHFTNVKPLRQWMAINQIDYGELAAMITVVAKARGERGLKNGRHVGFWLHPDDSKAWDIAEKRALHIEIATQGEVTAHELRPDAYPVPWGHVPAWTQAA